MPFLNLEGSFIAPFIKNAKSEAGTEFDANVDKVPSKVQYPLSKESSLYEKILFSIFLLSYS